MAQYGGEQHGHEEGHHTDEQAHNPLQSTAVGHDEDIEATKINTIGTGAAHGDVHEQGNHNGAGAGGILHLSGGSNSSTSEDDGEGGRRKKKGEKIKEKLPGEDEQDASTTTTVETGGGVGYEGEDEGHEKKGLMEQIKEKLSGSQQ